MKYKPGVFKTKERAVCPRCGERRGNRAGTKNGVQFFRCMACHRHWSGEIPPPPERTCPYCEGHCHKHKVVWNKGGHLKTLTPLQQWLGDANERQPERVTRYYCPSCKRFNTELWPSPSRPGKKWGPCRFTLALLLDSRAEEALVACCRKHKLQVAEAVRTIFREASYTRIGFPSGIYGKPPELPPDTPMPPLPDGRIQLAERKRGKLWGHQEVYVVWSRSVRLDAVSYRGLLRTMQFKKMSRQEAARYLIVGTEPKFVGCLARRASYVW